jgi:ribosomal protein S11
MFKLFPTLSRHFNNKKLNLKILSKIKLKNLKKKSQIILKNKKLYCLHIKSSVVKNFYTLTQINGKVVLNVKSGYKIIGQYNTKKKRFSTEALKSTLKYFIHFLKFSNIKNLILIFNGLYNQRNFVLKTLLRSGFKIYFIKYNSNLAHNGCRLPKPRSGFKV